MLSPQDIIVPLAVLYRTAFVASYLQLINGLWHNYFTGILSCMVDLGTLLLWVMCSLFTVQGCTRFGSTPITATTFSKESTATTNASIATLDGIFNKLLTVQ